MGDACPPCGRKWPADKLRDPDPERQVDIDEFLRYNRDEEKEEKPLAPETD